MLSGSFSLFCGEIRALSSILLLLASQANQVVNGMHQHRALVSHVSPLNSLNVEHVVFRTSHFGEL